MKHGDLEFHEQSARLNDRIAEEGLRIARENGWDQIEIRVSQKRSVMPGKPHPLHCFVLDPSREDEIDEATGTLLEASRDLFELFEKVGPPLGSMTMTWTKENGTGKTQRNTRYSYR